MAPTWRVIELDRGDAGVRVDRVLLRHLRDERGLSRNQIQKWIERGDVLINGAPPSRAAWRVQPGDDLKVCVARRERTRPSAEAIPLDVIYEDDDLLAINKPAGLVVHPSYKNAAGTLMNGVLQRARSWPSRDQPGLLGRLDKFTSGLVIVTKRPAIQTSLQRAMDARRIDKDYLAVVWGKPIPVRGTIDLALDRDPWDRRRITVTDRGGQPSVTRYERVATTKSGSAFSLVRCRLITGRTHQIRVHLSAKGWPIVGDAAYGRRGVRPSDDPATEAARAFPRQALHAWRLSFRHPVDGTELTLTAPLPDDLRALCSALTLPTL
ncbi:MAG: RluA family pseudouridine synthase [Vicinamibacterales bacterium]